ncbi:MAG: hypothetical protein QOH34_1405, partial [Mycobacterium sp.]|nr:hypothetical protein [Mycobacterium sp.]
VEHANDPLGKVLHELPEFGELADKYGLTYGGSGLDGRHQTALWAERAFALSQPARSSLVRARFGGLASVR